MVGFGHRARGAAGLIRAAWLLVTCALALGSSACGDGDAPVDKSPEAAGATNSQLEYSVKGFLVRGGKRSLVKFGPPATRSEEATDEAAGTNSSALSPPPQRTQAAGKRCVTGGTACTESDFSSVDAGLGTFDGETLLMALADSCVKEQQTGQSYYYSNDVLPPYGDIPGKIEAAIADPQELSRLPRVWDSRPNYYNWFVFAGETAGVPATHGCDEILARQEALLCTANRLAEIADAVSPVSVPADQESYSYWEFPVQDIKDKFILRDLAIATLGHVALLESHLPTNPESASATFYNGITSCSGVYAKAMQITDLSQPQLFIHASHWGVGWLPLPHEAAAGDPARTITKARELVAMRAGYKTNIFRATARLLRDLLDKSIQADIAGAEKKRADAGDPALGLRLMWGADANDETSGYNSMRHAFRLLFGRLDWMKTSWTSDENNACESPNSAGRTPVNTLIGTLGPGFSARYNDRPPQTAGQSLALSLVNQSGVLLPPATYADDEIRSILADQLQRIAARQRGVALAAFQNGQGGKAITNALSKTAIADLRFGLERNLDAYRQLGDTANVLSFPSLAPAGLEFEVAADLGTTLKAKMGTAVKGGIPRSDLHIDMAGATGRAKVASQCGGGGPEPYVLARTALQSPFLAASALQTRLQVLGSAMALTGGSAAADVVRDAKAAAAEVRTWAGPGLLVGFASDGYNGNGDEEEEEIVTGPARTFVSISLVGVKPDEIGATDLASMPGRLAVVKGAPWKADCVAGLRSDDACPANRASLEVTPDSGGTSTTPIPQCTSLAGDCGLAAHFGGKVNLTFTTIGAVLNSDPDAVYTVVTRPVGGTPGRVLGSVNVARTRYYYSGSPRSRVEVISDYQRELLNQVFGTSNPSRRTSTCGDITTTAVPQNYCVSGMQRDMFVPLSNELTSEGGSQEDSWKHYLALAESAAAKADELGRQLIEVGERRDLRREGAQEALAGVCGTFADIDSISVKDGRVEGDENDSALNACMNGATIDVVRLTTDPWEGKSSEDADTEIRDRYCTGNSNAPKFCSRSTHATHRALGLPAYTPPIGGSVCEGALLLAADVAGGVEASKLSDIRTRLSQVANEPFVSREALFAGFGGVQLKVRKEVNPQDGQVRWEGYRYGKLLLAPATSDLVDELPAEQLAEIYPACVAAGCTGTAALFERIFSPAPDHSTIRRKIESALFYLGALAGNVPEGTFTVPVPVYNGTTGNGDDVTWAPAIYGSTAFSNNSADRYSLIIEPNNPARDEVESHALGVVTPAPAAYWAARFNEDDDQMHPPAWRRSLYDAARSAPAGKYLAVDDAKSPALYFNALLQGDTLLSRKDNVAEYVRDFATKLDDTCVEWPSADRIFTQLAALNDMAPTPTWNNGSSSDRVAVEQQRNICHSKAHPVFYEDGRTRSLHLRSSAWHAVGGPGTFVDAIEDIHSPNDAMHKERALFFEPFSKCARIEDPARVKKSCIPWDAYVEPHNTLLQNAGIAALAGYVVRPESIDGEGNFRSAVEHRLQPSTCTPGDRAELFLNRYPDNTCELGQSVINALAMACVLSQEPVKLTPGEGPPAIESLQDIPRYEAWLELVELRLSQALNEGYFTEFPAVVADRTFTGSLGEGSQGNAMLDLANQVEAMHGAWTSMAGAVRELRSSVRTFRLEIATLDNAAKQRHLSEKQEKLRLVQEILVNSIKAVAATTGAIFRPDKLVLSAPEVVGAVATAGVNIAYAGLQLDALAERRDAGDEGDTIAKERETESFNQVAARTFDALDGAVTGIRTASNGMLTALNNIASNRRQAEWEIAKATGSDFAMVDDQALPLHVNTVLNRQYNILRLRYERALQAAKRAAYLARLSMEQRIGVRLADLRAPIGPIQPPATWVEDLCSVQGIDYSKLRTADPETSSEDEGNDSDGDGQVDSLLLQGFANQYVGDYVAQLREFIEFYNVEFPFRQADDTAVLSLREDLLQPAFQCEQESVNLLYHSDALFKTGQKTQFDFGITAGWSYPSCSDEGCLYVQRGSILNNGTTETPVSVDPPTDSASGAVSWLYVTDGLPTAPAGSGGDSGVALNQPEPQGPAPFETVYQTVPLRGGRFYVLSWWDMARKMNGAPLEEEETPQSYVVTVYDQSWQVVALLNPVASDGVGPTAMGGGATLGVKWSQRRSLSFTAFRDGDYHIAISPGELGQRGVSLAIANLQLEEPDKNLASASIYHQTGATRTVINAACKSVSSEQLRASFVRRCEGGRGDPRRRAEQCYYELDREILIDAELHDLGYGGLVGKVGQGNYNIRHVDASINLVGTGVTDCAGTGSVACNGAAFVEYDLDHVAYNAAIVDYGMQTHCFDFAKGSIKNGKALAAERYITLPLSSGDDSLLSQPAFRKSELFGRPLSGSYKLRIKDSPRLVWENIEDIQLVLGHRYWSRVSRP